MSGAAAQLRQPEELFEVDSHAKWRLPLDIVSTKGHRSSSNSGQENCADKPAQEEVMGRSTLVFREPVTPGWIRRTGAGSIPVLAEIPA